MNYAIEVLREKMEIVKSMGHNNKKYASVVEVLKRAIADIEEMETHRAMRREAGDE